MLWVVSGTGPTELTKRGVAPAARERDHAPTAPLAARLARALLGLTVELKR